MLGDFFSSPRKDSIICWTKPRDCVLRRGKEVEAVGGKEKVGMDYVCAKMGKRAWI